MIMNIKYATVTSRSVGKNLYYSIGYMKRCTQRHLMLSKNCDWVGAHAGDGGKIEFAFGGSSNEVG